jgi:hypothetical protein
VEKEKENETKSRSFSARGRWSTTRPKARQERFVKGGEGKQKESLYGKQNKVFQWAIHFSKAFSSLLIKQTNYLVDLALITRPKNIAFFSRLFVLEGEKPIGYSSLVRSKKFHDCANPFLEDPSYTNPTSVQCTEGTE